MKKKILFVVTSHNQLGDTGKPTGYYLAEVTHPWAILRDAGYVIDFVSPKGGNAPAEAVDMEDAINKCFWEDSAYLSKIQNTLKPSEVNPDEYVAIFYAGGHGVMWDFADNPELANIAAKIYEQGGIVSAVCHGPAALLNIKLSSGEYLIQGKKINSFTNKEEIAVGTENTVPFMLETALRERGAAFEGAGLWESHTTVDQRIITGQNPQSAKNVGRAILNELSK